MNRKLINIIIVIIFIFVFLIIKNFNSIKYNIISGIEKARSETTGFNGEIKNGKKQGEWVNYYKNGKIAELTNYLNDTLNGVHISYATSGKYKVIEKYNMGIRVDTFKRFSSGKLYLIEYYDSLGIQQGEFRIYNDDRISQIGYYMNGKMHGEYKSYDLKTGKLKKVVHYNKGEKSGDWVYINENGDTTKIENYD